MVSCALWEFEEALGWVILNNALAPLVQYSESPTLVPLQIIHNAQLTILYWPNITHLVIIGPSFTWKVDRKCKGQLPLFFVLRYHPAFKINHLPCVLAHTCIPMSFPSSQPPTFNTNRRIHQCRWQILFFRRQILLLSVHIWSNGIHLY